MQRNAPPGRISRWMIALFLQGGLRDGRTPIKRKHGAQTHVEVES